MARDRANRLPDDVRPERYRITLRPDLESFTFRGEEYVDLTVVKPTNTVVFNVDDLKIQDAYLLQGMAAIPARSVREDEKRERATVFLEREALPGPATLVLKFTGTLNDQLRGFYRSKYTDPQGKERYLATTQFEATDARRAFPCWDEPSLKATFQVTLVVPSELAAVSNTPVVDTRDLGDGHKALRFAETPRMSTYLLAFIVGDLTCVEAKAKGGTLMRVWATRGNEKLGRFALDTSLRLLDYFNDYFDIPYPLAKLDQLAIPDFAAGAMENWGAITYREAVLLFDPENSAAATKQRIVEIIAHEMAHMWFGDLVTMEWWNDLWLNESFASWIGNKAAAHLYPEWSMWTQFLFQDTGSGLRMDGLRNSHPIEALVKDPSEIRELFDDISYSKGASILWMLEQFLGEEAFRQGLHQYLSAHQYGNARTADLWKALEEVSGQPVTSLMDSWVKQTGFPVLKVKAERGGMGVGLTLTQERFLYDHLVKGDQDPTLWQVPVRVARAGGRGFDSFLMSDRQVDKRLRARGKNGDSRWIKVNAGQTGFFRVAYPPGELTHLQSAVEALQLPATDRLGLQSDAFALMRAGLAPATQFLELAESYRRETDATVWNDLSANLRDLEILVADQPYLGKLHTYGERLYKDILAKVGWDPAPREGHLDALLRTTVLAMTGYFGEASVIKEARSRFGGYVRDPSSLRADIRGVVYALAGQEGNRTVYDTLWELERGATLQEEKRRLLAALTRPRSKKLLTKTLERSLSDEVRAQDAVLVIVGVAANRSGRDLAWEFLRENWSELDRRYGKGGFMFMRLVGIAENFTTLERAEEVEDFFRTHPAPSAQRTVQQALETIRLNARWLALNGAALGDWLKAKG